MELINSIAPYLIIPVVFALIYALYVRPQKTADKKQQKSFGSLKKGDEVITVSGVFASVEEIMEDTVILAVIPSGILVKVKWQAIAVYPEELKRQRLLDENLQKMDRGEDFDPEYRKKTR